MRRGAVRVIVASVLVGAGLMWTPGARAGAPAPIGPPYPAADQAAVCYPEDSEHCSASAVADAGSGEIDLDVTVETPDGGTDDSAWGIAEGAMLADFELTEPAAAVAVRATFHIDHAELGSTGPGDVSLAQATLFGQVNVSHDSCAECEDTATSTFFEFALDEEYVEIDSETVVVETRLEHPDGDVPPGTLDFQGLLQADSFLWHDGAATVVANADAELTGFEVVAVGSTPTRTPSKAYIGPGGDAFYAHGTGPNCTSEGLEVGGACFRLDPGDEMVGFELTDDHTGGPIGGQWHFYDDEERLLGSGEFCGTSERMWVPDGATNITLFTRTARSHLDCTDPTPATTGTVTATFWG